MARVALYDACVLYPAALRSLLVQVAAMGFVRARWSEGIHKEWIGSLLRNRADLTRAPLDRVAELMNAAVPDSMVTGYEDLIPGLHLPDPDDRHVLAAAIAGRADTIVTLNLKDFPAAALAPFGIEAQHPDGLMRALLDEQPLAIMAVRACRLRLKAPAKTAEDYLATLQNCGLQHTVAFLRERSGEI